MELTRAVYNKLGQYAYGRPKDISNIKEWIGKKYGFNVCYVGQMKEDSNEREGIGITVYLDGVISEGNWKNDKLNGQGRRIDI